jgi:hypothetical protein
LSSSRVSSSRHLRRRRVEEVRPDGLGEVEEVAGVALPDELQLVALLESLEGELADRGQAAEPRLASAGLGAQDEALVDQGGQGIEDLDAERAIGIADRLGRLQRPAAHEHGQAPEQRLLGRREQVVAPGDGAAQRLVARRHVTCPAGQEAQALREARQDRLRLEQLHARRGQLDGQRQAVEPTADLRDRRRILVRGREVRSDGLGADDE